MFWLFSSGSRYKNRSTISKSTNSYLLFQLSSLGLNIQVIQIILFTNYVDVQDTILNDFSHIIHLILYHIFDII